MFFFSFSFLNIIEYLEVLKILGKLSGNWDFNYYKENSSASMENKLGRSFA